MKFGQETSCFFRLRISHYFCQSRWGKVSAVVVADDIQFIVLISGETHLGIHEQDIDLIEHGRERPGVFFVRHQVQNFTPFPIYHFVWTG